MTNALPTVLVLSLCLAVAACKDSTPPPVALAPKPAVAAPSPAQVLTPSEISALKLALDSEGLRVFNTVSGASRLLPFGMSRPELVKAVSAAQKAPPLLQGDNIACRAAYASWPSGLTVLFARDRFAGWSALHADPSLATASGIGVGSTRAELEGAYTILVTASSPGSQFTAGGLAGLLDSTRPDARVSALWAGMSCNTEQGA